MAIPDTIVPEEELGRGVFSKKQAQRARRTRVPHHAFLVQVGHTEISVDRLTFAPLEKATEIAEETATARSATFYGWAVVIAEKAGDNGRRVMATPRPEHGNPYHSNIVLPERSAEDREEQKRHAQELADASCWRERPDA